MSIITIKRITLFTSTVLCAWLSLPVLPVHAEGPVNLEIHDDSSTVWTITDIKPGDTGTRTMTLYNAGTLSGSVTIWIDSIINTEGLNPESETGDISEPGELGYYMLFNISCNGLSSNTTLPNTLEAMPQSIKDDHFLKIEQLDAGESMDITWRWKLPEETGNCVQGDTLTFSIHFLLEESGNSYEGSNETAFQPGQSSSEPESKPVSTPGTGSNSPPEPSPKISVIYPPPASEPDASSTVTVPKSAVTQTQQPPASSLKPGSILLIIGGTLAGGAVIVTSLVFPGKILLLRLLGLLKIIH